MVQFPKRDESDIIEIDGSGLIFTKDSRARIFPVEWLKQLIEGINHSEFSGMIPQSKISVHINPKEINLSLGIVYNTKYIKFEFANPKEEISIVRKDFEKQLSELKEEIVK
jgi:hypothetical protein